CEERPQSAFCTASPQIRANIEKVEAMRKADRSLAELYNRQNQSYRDARIRAVVALAPAVGPAFTKTGLAPVQIPAWTVVREADRIAPAEEHAAIYAWLIRGGNLTVIPHAGHMIFGGECTAEGRKKLAALCVDPPSVDRPKVLHKIAADALDFFNANLGL